MKSIPPQSSGSFDQPPPQAGYGGQTPPPPAPAKKGLSKGCIIGIIIAVVLVVGLIILLVAGGAGFYWLNKQAANMNGNTTTGTRGSASGSGGGGGSANAAAEAPQPTDAQKAAVSGGQSAVWDQQEISWTVPQRWTKSDVSSQQFYWRSPGSDDAASLIVSISPMSADFPVDASANAFYDQAQTRKKNGEVEEVKWLLLDGVRGVMFRESAPESSDGPQRLQWIGYRDYKGQKQMVNIMLASRGKDFAHHEDALYGILYSTKWSK